MNLSDLAELSRKVRLDIIDLAYRCEGPAHIGGALSIVEILVSLYGTIMQHNPKDPQWENRDRFILSKGHGVLAFYSALHQCGYFSRDKLLTFKEDGSDLIAHPVMNLELGIESSNGSLGNGLSMAVGMAWALNLKGIDSQVFTLVGDGECDEGSIWEAAMSASRLHLHNLTAIVDCNGFQSDGPVQEDSLPQSLDKKWKSFGWATQIVDGHSIEDLLTTIQHSYRVRTGKPKVVIAKTIKGAGIKFMENNNVWHHNRLTKSSYELARNELMGD